MYDQTKYNLMKYMFEEESRYENDITTLFNNVSYRKADTLDLLEIITAQVRLETAQKIFRDIGRILRNFKA